MQSYAKAVSAMGALVGALLLPLGGVLSSRSFPDEPAQAAAAPDPEAVYKVGKDVAPPRVVYAPSPRFIENGGNAGYKGTVRLELVVTSSGSPTSIRVTRSLRPDLDEQAIKTVQHWKFKAGNQRWSTGSRIDRDRGCIPALEATARSLSADANIPTCGSPSPELWIFCA